MTLRALLWSALIVSAALAAVSCVRAPVVPPERMAALVAGYPALYRQMERYGCPRCHTTGPQFLANEFKLPPPGQDDEVAVRLLWQRLDPHNLSASKLVRKPHGELGHRGGKVLNGVQRDEWLAAIRRWQQ
jgi:hypothetical protein